MQIGWISTALLAIALAMDAFAVSIVTGVTLEKLTRRHLFRLSFHFGLFQALMTLLGWATGSSVHRYVASYDHWIAFALLAVVGIGMIRGALNREDEKMLASDPTSGWSLVLLSVATSIDALAVGLSLAMTESRIFFSATVIGIVAAVCTLFGMFIGRYAGRICGKHVELLGGLILVGIGVNILVQHWN